MFFFFGFYDTAPVSKLTAKPDTPVCQNMTILGQEDQNLQTKRTNRHRYDWKNLTNWQMLYHRTLQRR